MSEILYEHTELLADPSNPDHACCSRCGKIQPIENFTRKPSLLQAERWGWNDKRDTKGKLYVGKECNACAKISKAKEPRNKRFDYHAYDKLLALTGRYEYLVQDPRYSIDKSVYITKRESMVLDARERNKEKQRAAGRRSLKKQWEPIFKGFAHAVKNEKQRAQAQLRQMAGLSEEAKDYLTAYITHLEAINGNIRADRYDTFKQPRETVQSYINPLAMTTKDVAALYRELSYAEKERVACKFI